MHKNEFIRQVAKESGVPQTVVGQVLGAAVRVVGRSLVGGGKVVWTGFGTFEMRQRSRRRGINPQTGEQITIAATLTPGFTASSTFKNRVVGMPVGAAGLTAPPDVPQPAPDGDAELLECVVAAEALARREHQTSAE